MSNFTLEQLPDQPVLWLTLQPSYVAERDLAASNPAVYDALERAQAPLHYIIDTRHVSFTIEDMLQVASATSRGEKSTFNHPNTRGVIVITENTTVKMALAGLDSDVFGHVKVSVAASEAEALAQIQA